MLEKIKKWFDSTSSKQFSLASKICFVAGALLIALSVALHFNAISLVAGIIVIVVGVYFRRKAKAVKRKFEWREKYKVAV